MQHIIVQMNFGDFIPANARASVADAARRWGCELRYLTQPWGTRPASDHFGIKLQMNHLPDLPPDCRLLWLDGDVLVRHDCPNPFEIVPETHMGGVLNYQGDTHADPVADHDGWWEHTRHLMGTKRKLDLMRYINGGVILWTHSRHTWLWWWIGEKLQGKVSASHAVNPLVEQSALNIAIAENDIALHLLPCEFNRLGGVVWENKGYMPAYICHWANIHNHRGDKQARMEATEWRAA